MENGEKDEIETERKRERKREKEREWGNPISNKYILH